MSGKQEGKSLFKNAVFSVIYRLLNILFPLISYGYAARILTSDSIGRHAAASNNVSYFVILGSLGIQAYATREIARRKDDKKERDKLFSQMILINFVLTCIACIAFVLCLFFVPLMHDEKTLYLICAIAIATNFINVDWYFQGTEDFKFIAVRSFVVKFLSLIAVFLFVRRVEDLYIYALISVLSNTLYHLISIVHAGRKTKIKLETGDMRRHLRPLLFLALCTVSTELYARMDITMLDVMEEHSTVAFYSYSQKIVNLIVIALIAITAVFLPRLSYYYLHDRDKFNMLTKFGTDMMIFISIPMCLGLSAVASPLVSCWLGSGYEKAVPCLIVLSFMIPLKCIGDIVCYQVMMCAGQEFYLMISYFITLAINFVNNMILIPRYGALGASIASLISEIVVFVIVFFAARKYQSYKLNVRNLLVVGISSVLMFCAVMSFCYLFKTPWVQLLGGTLIGGVVFVLINLSGRNMFLIDEIKNVRKDKGTE